MGKVKTCFTCEHMLNHQFHHYSCGLSKHLVMLGDTCENYLRTKDYHRVGLDND